MSSEGTGGAAHLTGIAAAPSAAAWVRRGVCENAVDYWHLPGAREVYAIGRTPHSVGVDSLVWWRWDWYVIHMGPNTTPARPGTVDDPQLGTGTPGYGTGCECSPGPDGRAIGDDRGHA